MKNAVAFQQVSFSYESNCVLYNCSFHIPQNSISVLFGPSGSGKTTSLRLMAGLEIPSSGTISLLDSVSNSIPPNKRNVGYCFQEPALWPAVTVKGHIELCIKQNQETVNSLLNKYHLGHVQHHYPHQLSGGEKKRLDFARAVAANPKLLLLDEPLSSVEEPLREELIQLIEDCRSQGGTIAAVTHQKDEMFSFAEHLVILHHGEVLNEGKPEDLYNQPKNRLTAELLGLKNLFEVECNNGIMHSPFGGFSYSEEINGTWLAGCGLHDFCVTVDTNGNGTVKACPFVAGNYLITFVVDGRTYQSWTEEKIEPENTVSVSLKNAPIKIEPLAQQPT